MNSRDALVPATATQEELNAKLALSTKPKIEPEDLEKAIASEAYHVFPGSCLTVCVLTLNNGFTVTGESACADPGNFKEDIGRTISRRNAKDKIWSLLGFMLRDQLYRASLPRGKKLDLEHAELDGNVQRLTVFLGSKAFESLSVAEQADLKAQHHHMLEYRWFLGRRRDRALSE